MFDLEDRYAAGWMRDREVVHLATQLIYAVRRDPKAVSHVIGCRELRGDASLCSHVRLEFKTKLCRLIYSENKYR